MTINNAQLQVEEFHKAAKATISECPTLPDKDIQELRLKLIAEEYQELKEAFKANNLVEVADAIGDLLYVVLGTAVTCGIPADKVFEEIHRSNMTKFIDGFRREDGKWIKGPSYSEPDLKSILSQNKLIK